MHVHYGNWGLQPYLCDIVVCPVPHVLIHGIGHGRGLRPQGGRPRVVAHGILCVRELSQKPDHHGVGIRSIILTMQRWFACSLRVVNNVWM